MARTPRPGPYPMADRTNLFGTLYLQFFDQWNRGGGRDECWALFEGILGIAQSIADQAFTEAYEHVAYEQVPIPDAQVTADPQEIARIAAARKLLESHGYSVFQPTTSGKPRTLTITDMSAIVRQTWALMTRERAYDYEQAPFDDEEIRLPAVAP